jgi:hypothetical protein
MDLTRAVLARLTEFVSGLGQQDLSDLAAGTAELSLVRTAGSGAPPYVGSPSSVRTSKPGRRAVPARSTESFAVGSAVAADAILSVLLAASDRAEAARYLDGLGLTAPQLRGLAKSLKISVSAKATKSDVRDTIVQWTVGRRVDAAVLSGMVDRDSH